MTSLSTRFLGQPRLMKPTFTGDVLILTRRVPEAPVRWLSLVRGVRRFFPPEQHVKGERYLVRVRGAPNDDAVQFHFIVDHRADLNQFGFDYVGFSHEPSAAHEPTTA